MHLSEDYAHSVHRHREGYPLPAFHLDQNLVNHKVIGILGERRQGRQGEGRGGDIERDSGRLRLQWNLSIKDTLK